MKEAFLPSYAFDSSGKPRGIQGAEAKRESQNGSWPSTASDYKVATYHLSSPSPLFFLLRLKAIARDDLPLERESGEEVGNR